MNPEYAQIRFIKGAAHASQFPPDDGTEVAFAGRSNAGKSSAINAILGRASLARTSKTPGRTREINFFGFDDRRRLVDLPGYGFARVPDSMRRRWGQTVDAYLASRRSLRGVILVMDVRRPLTDLDRQLIDCCAEFGCPIHLLLTKADKLARGRASAALETVRKQSREISVVEGAQLFSALRRSGVDSARAQMDQWLGSSA